MQGAASALHAFFDNYLGMYGHLRSHIAAVLYARRTVRHPTSLRRLRQTLDVVGRLLRHDGRTILGGMAAENETNETIKIVQEGGLSGHRATAVVSYRAWPGKRKQRKEQNRLYRPCRGRRGSAARG